MFLILLTLNFIQIDFTFIYPYHHVQRKLFIFVLKKLSYAWRQYKYFLNYKLFKVNSFWSIFLNINLLIQIFNFFLCLHVTKIRNFLIERIWVLKLALVARIYSLHQLQLFIEIIYDTINVFLFQSALITPISSISDNRLFNESSIFRITIKLWITHR